MLIRSIRNILNTIIVIYLGVIGCLLIFMFSWIYLLGHIEFALSARLLLLLTFPGDYAVLYIGPVGDLIYSGSTMRVIAFFAIAGVTEALPLIIVSLLLKLRDKKPLI